MAERLCSVGIDVGTTTTQLIVSELTAENTASGFSVPRMEIVDRKLLYCSEMHFTPLLSAQLVDGEGVRRIVLEEYAKAGLTRQQVDTGAVIITGETSRKENAAQVLRSLSDLAGEMVVATAGPDLESVLAAKGAGAVEESRRLPLPVLHMDIGGGTANLALLENGRVAATGCFNVGGRLFKCTGEGRITYISPVLEGLTELHPGEILTPEAAAQLTQRLTGVLEAAAGLQEPDAWFYRLVTAGTIPLQCRQPVIPSFSGGVADCIREKKSLFAYGDIGPALGQAIKKSRLCRGEYLLSPQSIRATVIGAGCHSTQLSGSTVYLSNVALPLHNMPIARISREEQALPRESLAPLVSRRLDALEDGGFLYLPGWVSPPYSRIAALADALALGFGQRPCYVLTGADMAKALGNALALRLPKAAPCLCLDQVEVPQDSYLDVLGEVGSAISLVVKTLILT